MDAWDAIYWFVLFLLIWWASMIKRIRQLEEDAKGAYSEVQFLKQDVRILTGRVKLIEDENKKAMNV
jgi:hypothetical protein